jgi:hypothetical protein
MLCTKDQMAIRTNGLFSSRIDAARFITNLNQMTHGFVTGNLFVGSLMAVATTLVLWGVGVKGAIPLGIASGLLNLLPFLGLIASLSGGAPSVQHTGTIYCHHSDDSLPVRRVGESSYSEIYCKSREYRAGGGNGWDSLLGWLWGVMGLLLAVPLTAFIKLVADVHPSLCHLSNMLALTPRPTPRWVRYSETASERAIPYLRPRG